VLCALNLPDIMPCCAVQAQRASLQKKLEERQADLEAKKAALAAVRAGKVVFWGVWEGRGQVKYMRSQAESCLHPHCVGACCPR
jgi:hypothetical protein